MCSGAAFWTQIGRVVFGAWDAKRNISEIAPMLFHPSTTVSGGVLEKECAALLSVFFKSKRLPG
jgi:tRNA(adenine34) deaminase